MNGSDKDPQSTTRGPGRLGEGLSIEGDVVAGEDLVVEGRLTGGLQAPDHAVTIGAGATVKGRVFARVVLIEGTVQGEVTATGLIDIAESARVEADMNAPSVAIAQGAYVVGRSTCDAPTPPRASRGIGWTAGTTTASFSERPRRNPLPDWNRVEWLPRAEANTGPGAYSPTTSKTVPLARTFSQSLAHSTRAGCFE